MNGYVQHCCGMLLKPIVFIFVKVKIIRFVVCSVIELFFSREDKVVIYVSLML